MGRECLLCDGATSWHPELPRTGAALPAQHGCLALPGRPEGRGCFQSQADKLAFVNPVLMLCRRFVCQRRPRALLFHPEIKRASMSCLLTGAWELWQGASSPSEGGCLMWETTGINVHPEAPQWIWPMAEGHQEGLPPPPNAVFSQDTVREQSCLESRAVAVIRTLETPRG